jgi:hypothetical protein
MLKENRTTRYLLYAIGEIFLVMVGILLALQVSTWNQERQARKKEQVLLKELHEEFVANKAQLAAVVAHHKRALAAAEARIAEFPINIATLDLDSFALRSKGFGSFWTFNPSQGIINSLVNTSSFDLISDPELRELLVSWNDVLADYQEEEERAAKVVVEQIRPFMAKHLSFHGGYLDPRVDLSVLESPEYENWIIIRRGSLWDILGDGTDDRELYMIEKTIDRIIELSAPEE